jgi:hypothetical protein
MRGIYGQPCFILTIMADSKKITGQQFTIIKGEKATWISVNMNAEFEINRYFNVDLIKFIQCGKKLMDARVIQERNQKFRDQLLINPRQIRAREEENYNDIPYLITIVIKPSWELSFSYNQDDTTGYQSDLKLLKEVVGLQD